VVSGQLFAGRREPPRSLSKPSSGLCHSDARAKRDRRNLLSSPVPPPAACGPEAMARGSDGPGRARLPVVPIKSRPDGTGFSRCGPALPPLLLYDEALRDGRGDIGAVLFPWGSKENHSPASALLTPPIRSAYAGCPILRALCEGWDSTVASRLASSSRITRNHALQYLA
jgi:hypothetical protein